VIQVGLGAALLLAGLFMAKRLLQLYRAGGDALGLTPASDRGAGYFVLGAPVTLGIDGYGPSRSTRVPRSTSW
jgi:hypothetical protein